MPDNREFEVGGARYVDWPVYETCAAGGIEAATQAHTAIDPFPYPTAMVFCSKVFAKVLSYPDLL
jgi:hypothetical protein